MTRTITFTVTFFTPFRVGSSYGRDGVDLVVAREDPLPGTHLKGLMRASATQLASLLSGADPALHRSMTMLVNEVFGTTKRSSPWAWGSARVTRPVLALDEEVEPTWQIDVRHRVAIDAGTGAAAQDQLVFAEQCSAKQAEFDITCTGAVGPNDALRHEALLRTSAAGVHALGAWRRRGLGWVGIAPSPAPDEAGTAQDLAVLRGDAR